MSSNLPPGCNSDDGMTPEERGIMLQFESLCGEIWEWVNRNKEPLENIIKLRRLYKLHPECQCRSYFERTGEHSKRCPIFTEEK